MVIGSLLSRALQKTYNKKSSQIMRSQEAKNRKEKQGEEEERRTSKLEPKIQVLVHLFLVLLLLLLLDVFSTHASNGA